MSPRLESHAAAMRSGQPSIGDVNRRVLNSAPIPTLGEAQRLAQQIAERHRVPLEVLLKVRQRRGEIQNAQVELAQALKARGWSLTGIARFMGSRHHTSVMAMLRKCAIRKLEPGPAMTDDLAAGAWV
jgi:chromosomal replication initiation ATPase DnaA